MERRVVPFTTKYSRTFLMKILQSAPIDIAVSPNLKYAGTERVIFELNRDLHERGHESLVAASGDSNLGGLGELVPTVSEQLWKAKGVDRTMVRSEDAYAAHYAAVLDEAEKRDVDVIHDHPGQFLVSNPVYLERGSQRPIVTTIHEDTTPRKKEKYTLFRSMQEEGRNIHFLGISNSHAAKYEAEGVRIDGVMYNGVPLDTLGFREEKQDYLFWLGRVSSIKGADLAVRVAEETGRPLLIAGEVHDPDRSFYDERIKNSLTHIVTDPEEKARMLTDLDAGQKVARPGERIFIGPVNDAEKAILFQNAYGVLAPNRWDEPFGLVMVEGMATGTPCIGTRKGALPELIKEGETGFIVDYPTDSTGTLDEEALVQDIAEKTDLLGELRPKDSRDHVKEKFSRQAMGQRYEDFYRSVLVTT